MQPGRTQYLDLSLHDFFAIHGAATVGAADQDPVNAG
jgi:hypothetical protein